MNPSTFTSFISALRHYMGLDLTVEGSGLKFLNEYKALTDKDKDDLKEMLKVVGYVNLI